MRTTRVWDANVEWKDMADGECILLPCSFLVAADTVEAAKTLLVEAVRTLTGITGDEWQPILFISCVGVCIVAD